MESEIPEVPVGELLADFVQFTNNFVVTPASGDPPNALGRPNTAQVTRVLGHLLDVCCYDCLFYFRRPFHAHSNILQTSQGPPDITNRDLQNIEDQVVPYMRMIERNHEVRST